MDSRSLTQMDTSPNPLTRRSDLFMVPPFVKSKILSGIIRSSCHSERSEESPSPALSQWERGFVPLKNHHNRGEGKSELRLMHSLSFAFQSSSLLLVSFGIGIFSLPLNFIQSSSVFILPFIPPICFTP